MNSVEVVGNMVWRVQLLWSRQEGDENDKASVESACANQFGRHKYISIGLNN
jgi:hypothetical protein